jgi:hypothetical protein
MAESPRNGRNRNTYYVLGGVALLGIAYVVRARSKAKTDAAAAASSNSVGATVTPSTAQTDATTQELASLQDQIANLQGAASTPAPSANGVYQPPSGESLLGSGYGLTGGASNVVSDSTGSQYQQVVQSDWKNGHPNGQFAQLLKTGTPLYYQPAPGIFSPFVLGKSGLAQGSPLFAKVGAQ